MTEQSTYKESAQSQGDVAPSTPSQESGQQSSAEAKGKDALIQELSERVARLERGAQSEKDRAINKLKKEFEAKLAELSGKPVETEKSVSIAAQPDTGTIGGVQAIPEALARFLEANLPISDADVSALIAQAGKYPTRESFLLDVERTINRKIAKPVVGPAAAVQAPSQAPGSPGEEELLEKYVEEMLAARGNPALLRRTKEKYKNLGVPVEKVGFK